MKTRVRLYIYIPILVGFFMTSCLTKNNRTISDFGEGWKFSLGNDSLFAQVPEFDDSRWKTLNLPHDWSIEGEFSESNPATAGGGALPGGIGWYRKSFILPEIDTTKIVYIDFDGVYMNSEVWINGQYLGKRPYGYSSFRYNLTPFLHFGKESNVLAVKVDNSDQPGRFSPAATILR